MSTLSRTRELVYWILGTSAALGPLPVFAQAYPTRPVELIVHTSAGSGGDVVSRAVSEIMRREKFLPQALMVNNRVGGAGALAYNFFKTKRGDPYFMLSVTGTILALAYRPDINIGLENYTPLALMAIDPQTVMVPTDSPYKTFKELVEAARKAPDTLVAATTSVQGTGRMVIFLIEKAVPGAKFRFVNFKGGADAVTRRPAAIHVHDENLSEGQGLWKGRCCACWRFRRPAAAAGAGRAHVEELGYPITAGTIRGFTFTAGVPKEAARHHGSRAPTGGHKVAGRGRKS